MNRSTPVSPPHPSTYVPAFTYVPGWRFMLILGMCAAARDARAAATVHGWGLVDWGMTEAQVESVYGNDVEKYPPSRNRRTEIVESLHLKNPIVINGVALTQSFAFLRTTKELERVVLRANLMNATTEQCQGAYQRVRKSEVDQLKAPFEEQPALRSLHAIWHGTAADAQLSLMEVTGRCLLTLVYKPPSPPNASSDGTALERSTTAPATMTPPATAP